MHINHGKTSSLEVTLHMDSILQGVMLETQAMADELSSGALPYNQLLERLEAGSNANPNILGMLAAFEPFQYSPEKQLYAPFFVKEDNEFIYIENFYDYTDKNLDKAQWYVEVRDSGPMWTEPSFAGAAKRLVADYGVPFYKTNPKTGEKTLAGTLTSTITLKSLHSLLMAQSLGNTGYAYAISKKGLYLSHPNAEYPKQGKRILEIAQKTENKAFYSIAQDILNEGEGFASYTNNVTDQDSWLFYNTINTSGWKVAVVMIKDELLANKRLVNQKKIKISIWACVSLLLLIVAFGGVIKGNDAAMWKLSISTSLGILFIIAFVWFLEIKDSQRLHRSNNVLISDFTGLNSFLNTTFEKASSMNEAKPIVIPTGIFVEEVEFISGYNVNLSGYVWQKYPNEVTGKVLEGFVFPQMAPDAEKLFLEEAYREQNDDFVLIGWNFRTTLRLNFDYSVYPFDRREINIRLRAADLSKNIVLAPDFESYKTLTPGSLPGTVKDLVIPGWQASSSYFDYRDVNYNTNFGYDEFIRQNNVPEYHFNILLKRHIISPFISTVIPLLVVAIMLFGVVLSTTKNRQKNVLAGFSAFGVVQTCAAFFFVIMLAHIDLRQAMDTEEITYIEYFYFIMYLKLLLVVFDVILFSNTKNTTIINYKDNLIMKLFYWPLLLSICLVITLLKFY